MSTRHLKTSTAIGLTIPPSLLPRVDQVIEYGSRRIRFAIRLDGTAREQLRMSRVAMDVVASGVDASAEPRFRETCGGRVWYGSVYFRKESEPSITLTGPARDVAHRTGNRGRGHLEFVWDVVPQIHVARR